MVTFFGLLRKLFVISQICIVPSLKSPCYYCRSKSPIDRIEDCHKASFLGKVTRILWYFLKASVISTVGPLKRGSIYSRDNVITIVLSRMNQTYTIIQYYITTVRYAYKYTYGSFVKFSNHLVLPHFTLTFFPFISLKFN